MNLFFKLIGCCFILFIPKKMVGQLYCPAPISPSLNIMHLRFGTAAIHFENEPVLNESVWIYAIKYNPNTESTICLGRGIYEGGTPLTITLNGQDDFVFGYLPNDTIQLIFERNNGCLSDAYITDEPLIFQSGTLHETDFVDFVPKSWLNLNATDGFCAENTATINVVSDPGQPSYTYVWSNGATTDSLSNLSSGIYTVTATSAFGCPETHEAAVTNLFAMELSFLTTPVEDSLYCESTAELTNGTAPYAYNWSNGATTETATNLENGEFFVTITDTNGCEVEGVDDCIINFINERTLLEKLHIYPNPTSQFLTIKIGLKEASPARFSLRNMTNGKRLFTKEFKNSVNSTLDLAVCPKGLYFLEIMIGEAVFAKKIIVQ